MFGFGLVVYILTLPADLRGNADTLYRFNITKSLVDHLTSHFICQNPGDTRVVRGLHGCYYSIYGPGQTLAMIPLYEVGKLFSYIGGAPFDFATALTVRLLDPLLGSFALVVFFWLCTLVGYRRRSGVLLTLALGFASTFWPDVQSGQDTPQITLFLLLAVYGLLRALGYTNHADQRLLPLSNISKRAWLFISGAAAGAGLATRYDFIVYIAVLAVFLVWITELRGKRFGGLPHRTEVRRMTVAEVSTFALGLLPFVLLDAAWNTDRFGAPWYLGQSALHQFGFPIWQGIPNLLISPSKGLLWYLPLVWLLPFAAKTFFERSPSVFWLCTGLAAMAVVFYANVIYWHGDPGWGPRYLYPVVPLLVLPLGEVIEKFQSFAVTKRVVIAGILGLSVVVQLAAVSVDGWRFWYHLVQVRQQAGQVFKWDYTRYSYYWPASNLSLDPELYQFASVKDVAEIATGNYNAYIHPAGLNPRVAGRSCKLITTATARQYDACRLNGISPRPLDTFSPIWINDRYQWYSPGSVPLTAAARFAVVFILLLIAAGCASLLGTEVSALRIGHEYQADVASSDRKVGLLE